MPSDNDHRETVAEDSTSRTPDRLCPTNYQSYRRHSSPSALGESAGFEFPDSSTDTPLSPGDDSPTPIRHAGPRNHSSPFLSRSNFRSRAQSSSSNFVSGGFDKDKSNLSLLQDEDIFNDLKFELQAPPKQRGKRSRASTSSGAVILSIDSNSASNCCLLYTSDAADE